MLRFICPLFLVLFVSGTVCGQAPRELAGHPPSHWIENLTKPSPTARASAAKALADSGGDEAVQPLIARLADPDEDVRLNAAYALGKINRRPEECIAALTRLLSDSDEHVRYSAQWALGQFAGRMGQAVQDASAAPPRLAALLKTAAATMARQSAPESLTKRVHEAAEKMGAAAPAAPPSSPPAGGLVQSSRDSRGPAGSGGSAEVLLRLLTKLRSPDTFDQVKAMAGVGKLDPASAALLMQAVAGGEDSIVDWKLPEELAKLGAPLIPALTDALAQGSEPVRQMAVNVLAKMGPSAHSAVPQLTKLLADEQTNEDFRQTLIDTLGEIGPPARGAAQVLAGLVADQEQPDLIRTESARVLGLIGPDAAPAAALLADVLKRAEEPHDLKRFVAEALAKITPGSATTASLLVSLMEHEELPDSQADFAEALGCLGQGCQTAVPKLVSLLEQPELCDHQCQETIAALGKFGPAAEAAAPVLIQLLKNRARQSGVHVAAAQTLSRIGPPAIRALAEELPKADAACRGTLARAIVEAGSGAEPALAQLCQALENRDELDEVRALAAVALGKIGGAARRAIPTLGAILQDHAASQQLRAMCCSAMGAIDPGCGPLLALALKDGCKDVQLAAAHALQRAHPGGGEALDRLVSFVQDEEVGEQAGRALVDIGNGAIEVVARFAQDKDRDIPQRVRYVDLLGEMGADAAPALVKALTDGDLEEAAANALCCVGHDAVPILLVSAEDERSYPPRARERMREVVRDLFDGLGAGGDATEWSPAHPLAPLAPAEPIASGMDGGIGSGGSGQGVVGFGTVGGIGSGGSGLGSGGEKVRSFPMLGPSNSATADTVRSAVPPDVPLAPSASASSPAGGAPSPTPPANQETTSSHKSVKVFYGTNRRPLTAASQPSASGDGTSSQNFSARLFLSLRTAAAVAFALCLGGLLWQRPKSPIAITASSLGLAVLVAPYLPIRALVTPRESAADSYAYGAELSDTVELGVCEVTIPASHQEGQLEGPSIFRLELRADPDKHIVVRSVQPLAHDAYFHGLDGELAQKGRNILVFVHGYNVSFEDAARRTAQMAVDLKFPGVPLFFSWPSQANWYQYRLDERNVELSVEPLKQFLLEVAERCQATTINLVAHSMGNRALTSALKEIDGAVGQHATLFNQVILAAPDIDANVFKQRIAPSIVAKARHITLYASSRDLALFASRQFNSGAVRAGDAGAGLVIVPGIETIDCSAGDSSLLGHTYYGDSVSILRDIENLLRNQPAQARPYLEPIAQSGLTYWMFQPPLSASAANIEVR